MNALKLKMSDETADLVRSLHPDIKRKIKAALQGILDDPMSGKKLKDELEGLQSFRVGKFRVIYKTHIDSYIIDIVAIGPRKSIYEETLKLLIREKHKS